MSEIETWKDFFRGAEVKGALPIRFRVLDGPDGTAYANLTMTVPCVENGIPIEVCQLRRLPPLSICPTERDRLSFLLSIVVDFYRHEAREQIYIGDERPLAPHEEH